MASADKAQKNISLKPETEKQIDAVAKQRKTSFYAALLLVTMSQAKGETTYTHIDLTPPAVGQRGKVSEYTKAGLSEAETVKAKALVEDYDKSSHKENIAKAIRQTLAARNTKR